MAVKAGEAFLELSVEDSKFGSGIKDALNTMRSFAGSLAAIGAGITSLGVAVTATFGVAARTFADFGQQLSTMSARTGIAVGTLSALQYAAQQSGVSVESLESVIRSMQRSLVGLGTSGKKASKVMQLFGIDALQLGQLTPDEQLQELLKILGNIQNPTTRAAVAMRIFGRSGTAILPLIDHWKALQAEAEHFNLTVSKDSTERASRLNNAFGLLGATFKALKFAIGDAIADSLTSSIRTIAEVVASTIKWVKANQALFATTFSVGRVIVGLGAAIAVLGATLPVLTPLISGMGIAMDGASLPFSLAKTALTALAGIAAFVATPFGAIVVAVAAAGAAFVYFSGLGGEIVRFLSGRFGELKRIAGETFSAIGDALSGGDIAAAANVLWAGLKLAWLTGTEELRVAWAAFSSDFIVVITDMVFEVNKAWVEIASGFKSAFSPLVAHAKTIGEQIGHALSRARSVEEIDKSIAIAKESIRDAKNTGFLQQELNARQQLANLEKERRDAVRLGPEGQKALAAEQDKEHQKALGRIKAEGEAAKAEIEKEKQARLAAIEASRDTPTDKDKKKADAIKAAQDAVAAQQKAFDAARARAKAARGKGAGLAADAFDPAAAGAIADAAKGLTRFTFSGKLAGQVFGAAGDPVPKQQLKVQQQQKDILEDIRNALPFGAFLIGGR